MEERLKQTKSNCLKVVILGPESSGKTTLVKEIAAYYNCKYVPEYSRIYAEEKLKKNKVLTSKDVLPIALGQMDLENKMAKIETSILICDTNLLETYIYSKFYYNGFYPEIIKKYALLNKYDIILLTNYDIPWEKDPVRNINDERKIIFELLKNELIKQKLKFEIISGDKTLRLKTIKKITQKHLNRKCL